MMAFEAINVTMINQLRITVVALRFPVALGAVKYRRVTSAIDKQHNLLIVVEIQLHFVY